MDFHFTFSKLTAVHPNTAHIDLLGKRGGRLSVTACSLGGGRIMVMELNGMHVQFSGNLPTLIVSNVDRPGRVSTVTGVLASENVNIATLQIYRDHPGGNAVMIIETDKPTSQDAIARLRQENGILCVTAIDGEG